MRGGGGAAVRAVGPPSYEPAWDPAEFCIRPRVPASFALRGVITLSCGSAAPAGYILGLRLIHYSPGGKGVLYDFWGCKRVYVNAADDQEVECCEISLLVLNDARV